MAEIKLSQGKFAIVDDGDFEYLSQFRWHVTDHGYACRKNSSKNVYMHRELMGFPKGLQIDHINGNGLDNRRSNLRVVTAHENRKNSGIRSDNVSGYKGVSWDRKNSKWKVGITVSSKWIHLGRFESLTDAAKAYNDGAIKYNGEYARLNVIKEEESA
ncbi:HNH endonuclease [Peribacillus frigoritolerans]|uniref:HNH endonuclease n=1 Tax=Peribacillus frigoritolerans TaxID=450367 RepID=UPI002E1A7D33|nr:HNH endonuclease [Peribacillus frigoritolerans]MED3845553.1 HNH endonuclease [Peribacillus frigoritolerans]